MQTSETGADTGSTVTLQTSVAGQAAVPTQVVQQVPVQQQVQQVQTVQQVQHVYPAQVQYVEGSDTVYTNGAIRSTTYPYTETQMYSQNTGGNYFDTQGSSAQVTTVVSSHSMVGTGGIQMGVTGGQLISSSGGTYLIGNSMENSGHTVTHTTRASPATIKRSLWGCLTMGRRILLQLWYRILWIHKHEHTEPYLRVYSVFQLGKWVYTNLPLLHSPKEYFYLILLSSLVWM